MAATIPTVEPTSIIAGDTVKWTRLVDDYSAADGWVLRYRLAGASVLTATATTDTDGVGFAVTISAADSASLVAGQYRLTGWVEYNGENFTVFGPSVVAVEPNYATAEAGDLQTSAERELALIEDAISSALSGGPIESYTIGGRSVQHRSLEELYKARGIIHARLARMGGSLPSHAMRFRAPC